jgi:hypothetical protein
MVTFILHSLGVIIVILQNSTMKYDLTRTRHKPIAQYLQAIKTFRMLSIKGAILQWKDILREHMNYVS